MNSVRAAELYAKRLEQGFRMAHQDEDEEDLDLQEEARKVLTVEYSLISPSKPSHAHSVD